MRWFRFYSDVVGDPKVQLMDPALFRFWVNTLCVCAEKDGVVPPIGELAFRLRVSDEEAARSLGQLKDRDLFDTNRKGDLRPHNWDARQYKADTSTERVNRYRERMRLTAQSTTSYLKHRDYLMRRDDGKCVYCGSKRALCIDHVVPVIRGGDDDPMNLAISCKSCNASKAGRTPNEAGMIVIGEAYSRIAHLNEERLLSTNYKEDTSRFEQQVQRLHATPPEQNRTEQNRTDTENTPKAPSQRGRIQSGWFSEFWDAYPLKKGKAAAERKYAAICKTPDRHAEIMAGLSAQLSELRSREPRFIPHPTTWLNQGRWEDEQPPLQPSVFDDAGYIDVRELNRRRAEGGE